jgi:hypothetical protein
MAIDNDLPEMALRGYNNLAETMTDRDRYEDGLELYERGLVLADRIGSAVWQRGLLSEIVFPLMMTGRWDEAAERATQVPDLETPGSDIIGLLVAMPVIRIARGDVEGAEEILEAFGGYGHSSDMQETAAFGCARASVLRARSRDEEALVSARAAMTGAMHMGYTGTMKVAFTQAIGAAFSLGDLDAVRDLVATIDAMRPGLVTPFLRALADRSRARIAALEGDGDLVDRNFKAAIGLFRETGIPYWRSLSQTEYAEWLMNQHRTDEATPLIAEARLTLERLDATRWLERIGGLEARVGAPG